MRMKRINTISTNDHVKLTGKLEKKRITFCILFCFSRIDQHRCQYPLWNGKIP